jgi:hypothetical protein
MMKKKIYLHIGYGKAGSTYLQNLFYLNSGFNAIFLRNKELKPLIIKKKIKFIKSSFKKNKINIISDEGFTSPFSNRNLDIYRKLDKIIKLLKKSFNLKIIIVVRNQKKWIISRFSQNPLRFVNVDKTIYSYSQLTKKLFQEKKEKKWNNFKKNIDYHKMFLFLNKRVNKKNFKFLIFEDLVDNENNFLKKLESFFKKKNIFKIITKKLDERLKYKTKKIKNYYLPKIKFSKFFYLFRRYGFNLTIKIYLFNKFLLPNKKENINLMDNYYKISNKSFSLLIKKNLKKYNYYFS